MADHTPGKVDKQVLGKGTAKRSTKGPYGGGNQYHQLAVGKGFLRQAPITGHTQRGNLKDGKPK